MELRYKGLAQGRMRVHTKKLQQQSIERKVHRPKRRWEGGAGNHLAGIQNQRRNAQEGVGVAGTGIKQTALCRTRGRCGILPRRPSKSNGAAESRTSLSVGLPTGKGPDPESARTQVPRLRGPEPGMRTWPHCSRERQDAPVVRVGGQARGHQGADIPERELGLEIKRKRGKE